MSVYHITYTPDLKEICLYLDESCQLSCHGCITNWHPKDYHLEEGSNSLKHQTINMEEAEKISERYLKRVYILHHGVKVKCRVERIY